MTLSSNTLEDLLGKVAWTSVLPVTDGSAFFTDSNWALELEVTFLLAVEADGLTGILVRAVVGAMAEQSAL